MDAVVTGWLTGAATALAGLVVGVLLLKALARARISWWRSLLGIALVAGPALGLIVGSVVAHGRTGAGVPGAEGFTGLVPAARVGWSLLVAYGATALFGLLRAFLSSRPVREDLGVHVPEVFFDMGRLFVWVAMAFVVVGVVWQRTDLLGTLLTASAAGTIVLGFALQDTIKNFIAAWAIVGEGAYEAGDWVWIGETEGEVVSVTRRATRLRTRTADVVTIPNGAVLQSHVRNMSRPSSAHAEVVRVMAPLDAAPNRVRDALRHAVQEVGKVLSEPAPLYRIHRFAESGVEYEVKFWIRDIPARDDIRSDVMVRIWYRFHREGLEIQVPVTELRPRRARAALTSAERGAAALARLKSVPFFQALPEDVPAVLARDAGFLSFGAGERVVTRGDPGEACYVVDDGRLAVLIDEGGTERTVAVLSPGELFGEMSLLTGEPRSATVRALEDARLVVVGSSALRTALEKSPELAQRLAEVAALRKEGLLGAKAALDAEARRRVDQHARNLRDRIRAFFSISDGLAPPFGSTPPNGPSGGVAGRPTGP